MRRRAPRASAAKYSVPSPNRFGAKQMSRVAKKPITLPKGVECKVANGAVTVKGPKGTLSFAQANGVEIRIDGTEVTLKSADANTTKYAGTARALIANMIKGVSEG